MNAGGLSDFFSSHARARQHSLFAILRWVDAKNPNKPLLGRGLRLKDDVVRLCSQPNLSFQATEINCIEDHPTEPVSIIRHFIHSLLGPNGPLPLGLTEQVLEVSNGVNRRDFLDIFHHRMNCLLYRAWAEAEPVIGLDRMSGNKPSFPSRVAAVSGYLHAWETGAEDDLSIHFKLHHAGQFSRTVRTAAELKQLLQACLGLPCSIHQNVRQMLTLEDEDVVILGKKECRLANNFTLGKRVPDVQFGFLLVLGPLTQEEYDRFDTQKTQLIPQLHALIRNWLGLQYNWAIQLNIKSTSARPFRLGQGVRLGFDTWTQSNPSEQRVLKGVSYLSSH
jgi:type VI secretion system protein ImpH